MHAHDRVGATLLQQPHLRQQREDRAGSPGVAARGREDQREACARNGDSTGHGDPLVCLGQNDSPKKPDERH